MNFSYLSQILGLPGYPADPQVIVRPPIVTPSPNVTVVPKNMDDSYYPNGQLPMPVAPPPYLMPPPVQPDIANVLPDYPSVPAPADGAADVPPPPAPSPDVLPYDNQAVVANPPGLLQEPPPSTITPAPVEERSTPVAAKSGGINPAMLGLSLLADANKPAPRMPPPPAAAYRPQMVSVDNLMKLYKGGLL